MKKRETKLQVQSILATVVMGMNLVNTAAPAVAVAMTEPVSYTHLTLPTEA